MKTKLLDRKVSDMTWKGYIVFMIIVTAISFMPWALTCKDDIKDWCGEKFSKAKDKFNRK